jgi:hypothetical protein
MHCHCIDIDICHELNRQLSIELIIHEQEQVDTKTHVYVQEKYTQIDMYSTTRS